MSTFLYALGHQCDKGEHHVEIVLAIGMAALIIFAFWAISGKMHSNKRGVR